MSAEELAKKLGPKPLTKDDYLCIRMDLIAKYEAMGKLIDSLNRAIDAGCFRNPMVIQRVNANEANQQDGERKERG